LAGSASAKSLDDEMIKTMRLTSMGIEKKKANDADRWMSDDERTRGGGRLVVRISTSGSKLFYFRYSIDGVRKQIPIGPFSLVPVEGKYTLDQAQELSRSYSAMHRDVKTRDVAAHLQSIETSRLAAISKQAEDAEIKRVKTLIDAKPEPEIQYSKSDFYKAAAQIFGKDDKAQFVAGRFDRAQICREVSERLFLGELKDVPDDAIKVIRATAKRIWRGDLRG